MQRIFAAILMALAVACSPNVPEPPPSDAGAPLWTAPDGFSGPLPPFYAYWATHSLPPGSSELPPQLPRADAAARTTAAQERLQARRRHGATNRLMGAKRPDDRITACTHGDPSKAVLMACLDALTRPQPVTAPGKLGAVRPPIVNPVWSVTDWYVNPSTGSDDNGCVGSGSPCKTVSEIIYGRWTTYAPQIPVGVTIHLLADTPANTDYLTLEPAIVPGGSLAIVGTTTTTCTTHTLASVTAKSYGAVADGRLSADLGACASGSQGHLIINSTRSSSVAWVDSCSGTLCKLTQPIAENVPTFNQGFPPPGEFDTWANGDSFTIQQPPKINLVSFKLTGIGNNAATTFAAGGYVGKVWVQNNDTGDAGATTGLRVNSAVSFIESRVDAFVEQEDTNVNDNENQFGNSWISQGAILPNGAIRGGAFGTLDTFYGLSLSGLITDDVILHGITAFGQRATDISILGPIYSDGTLTFYNDEFLLGDVGPGVLYGSYTIQGSFAAPSATALIYEAPASSAFAGVPTWQFCGNSAFATAYDRGVTPAQWYPHRTLSDTNLDGTISGKTGTGFSGLAVCDNGATVASAASQAVGSPSDRFVAGANVTLTENSPGTGQLTISASSGTSCPIDLVSCVTNTLQPVHGGSGVSSPTPAHGPLIAEGSSAFAVVNPGSTNGLPLLTLGSGSDPIYAALNLSGSGVTSTLGHANGGTDVTSPGASGNFLRSNGTNWFSSTIPQWFYAQGNGTAANPCNSTIFAGLTITVPAGGATLDMTATLTVGSLGTVCTLTWGIAVDNTACSFSRSTGVSTDANSGDLFGSGVTYENSYAAGSHTFDIQAGAGGGSGCSSLTVNDTSLSITMH